EALDIDICSDEYNTFAGMILDELGTIPEDGAVIELKVKNMEIKVTKIEEHRIEEAVVHLLEKPEDEPDDDED
ncbi:MAG: transporter associated domain-containing protein, partial [Oscillospiraceae bacterium]